MSWPVESVYADGGCLGRNPSAEGGTWATLHVGESGVLWEASGIVTPDQFGLPTITNNLTELLAVVKGLEALPDGWSGKVWTDSRVTMFRAQKRRKQARMNGIPEVLMARLAMVKRRLGLYTVCLLAGHPDELALARGRSAKGLPVSRWNQRCDSLCAETGRLWREQNWSGAVDRRRAGAV